MMPLALFLCLSLCPLLCLGQDSTELWLLAPGQKLRLQQSIKQYQQISTDQWHTFPGTLLLRPGDTSSFVPRLRQNLILVGDLDEGQYDRKHLYSPSLALAVARFQARHALKPDSIIGPRTVAALNVPLSQRLLQLQNSLSRWTAFSQDIAQPYIIINIPDYTLRLIDHNTVLLEMHTIVGKPALPTYVNRTDLHTIVFNPYWYIPNSIASKEILPLLKRNPGYLASRDMELFRLTALVGYAKTDPWSVNWTKVTSADFNFRIVQVTGEHNELGKVKFLFHTKVSQYLHDTKDKHLFALDKRAFSHGCIRLQHPEALAHYLMQERSGLSENKIDRFLNTAKPEQFIRLKKPVPLLIVYMTAWADQQLGIQFREDIYGYDKPVQVSME
ncbi:hypothetical protein OB13_02290 [Pontibacter sp. HJ8]